MRSTEAGITQRPNRLRVGAHASNRKGTAALLAVLLAEVHCQPAVLPTRQAPPPQAAASPAERVAAQARGADGITAPPAQAPDRDAPAPPRDECEGVPEDMACVPAGSFLRGTDDDPHRCAQPGQLPPGKLPTGPAQRIEMDTFFIDRTEVTNRAYGTCIEAGRCRPGTALYRGFHEPEQPVTGVSWHDAEQYCSWRGRRLPTEAEWEKAARGPDGELNPWGDEPASCANAVIQNEKGRGCGAVVPGGDAHLGRLAPVGSRPAGRYGIFDLAGNAEEWVADWWSESYAACGQACMGPHPKGPCAGAASCPGYRFKSVRGGSWYWSADHATSVHRRRHPPANEPFHHFGFRCAADPPATIEDILARVPLVDGHNDLAEQLADRAPGNPGAIDLARGTDQLVPPMQTDIPRLRRGHVGGTFFAAYVPYELEGNEAVRTMFERIALIRGVVDRYPQAFELALSADDVERIHHAGKIAALIGVEGGHGIGDSLDVLDEAHTRGARYLTLTHMRSNNWADAARWPGVADEPPRHHGLTAFGREVVRELNRLGMLVDLSHTSDETARDALDTSTAPVIWSHSSARALCHHVRNVPDDLLAALPKNGGIVMVNLYPGFLSEDYRRWDETEATGEWQRLKKLYPDDRARRIAAFDEWKASHRAPSVAASVVADHIDHIRRVAGIDHVGLGSDFDGIGAFPVGLEDPSHYPDLLVELLRRGYSPDDVAKVAGGNLLRVMRTAERVAGELLAGSPGTKSAPPIAP